MKKKVFSVFVSIGFFLAAVFAFSSQTWSQTEKYPRRNVDMIISAPPGGPLDLISRILGKYLEKEFGVPFIPINKPGGGGSLGAGIMASSKPDGYTLSVMAPSSIIMPVLRKEADFAIEDFTAICQVMSPPPVVFIVHPDSPWKTFQEFVDYAKKNPGIKCGHPLITTTASLKMFYVNKYANLKLVGVPFKTDSELNIAIMGKHIPIASTGVVALKGPLEAGKLRVLFSYNPAVEIRDVKFESPPPDFESFFGKKPGFDFGFYLWCNSKTPNEVVETLKGALSKIVRNPEFDNDLKKIGYSPKYLDGSIFMKEELPGIAEFLKEVLTEVGLIK